MRSQKEMRNLLGTGAKVTHVMSWERTLLYCVHAIGICGKLEPRSDDLEYLVQEISIQKSIQDVTCLLLTAYVRYGSKQMT